MRQDEQTRAQASFTIFSPLRSGPLYFKNRLVGLPIYSGYAYPDGRVSPQLLEHYHQLASSGGQYGCGCQRSGNRRWRHFHAYPQSR